MKPQFTPCHTAKHAILESMTKSSNSQSVPTEEQRWKELQKRVKEANAVVNANATCNLEFAHVMLILATFGPYSNIPTLYREGIQQMPESALLGWQRRAWNAILCAEKVIPLWTELSRVESNMNELLIKGRFIVQNETPLSQDSKLHLIPSLDDVSYQFQYPQEENPLRRALTAYYIVESAINTINRDVENEFELHTNYDESRMGDWWTIPNVIDTSLVLSGGYSYPNQYNQARKEFWLWWLNEAVPASWNLQEI